MSGLHRPHRNYSVRPAVLLEIAMSSLQACEALQCPAYRSIQNHKVGPVDLGITPPPPRNLPPNIVTVPPPTWGEGGHEVTLPLPPGGGGTMVALKLQQFRYNLQKMFLRRLHRLVFRMLFGPSDGSPPPGGTNCKGGGDVSRGMGGTMSSLHT